MIIIIIIIIPVMADNVTPVVKLRRKRWGGGGWHLRGRREMHAKFLVQKSEAKRPLGRSRHMWEDDIKMNL